MTKKINKTVARPVPVTDEQHLEAVQFQKEHCYKLSFVISGLPSSRRADPKASEEIAKSRKGTRKGIRTSWRLFLDTHPAVKELKAVIGELHDYRNRFATMEEEGGDDDAGADEPGAGDDEKKKKKAAGKRLIFKEDHKEIADHIAGLADRVAAAAERAQAHYGEIKANDRGEAGDLWREDAYPPDIRAIVGVPKDAYGYVVNFLPTVAIPDGLDPQIAAKLMKRAELQLSGSIECAVTSAVGELNKALTTFLGELANRVRVDPVPGHPLRALCKHGNPEVLRTKIHEQDAAVPPGHVSLYLSYKAADEDGPPDRLVTIKKWFGPYKEAEYEKEIRPEATEERKKIYPSVIEGLIAKMQNFRDVQAALLGAHGKNVENAFGAVMEALNEFRRLGDDNYKVAEKVAKTVKADEDFKAGMADLVAQTIEALDDSVTEVKKVRRRISSLILDDDED